MATIGLVPQAGLGMAASRLSQAGRPARVTEALYCPPAVRDDPALAAAVQQDVDEWAAGVGLAPEPAAGLGRLVVLAHPDTHDVGRLAVAARLLAVGRVLAGGALGASQAQLLAPAAEAGTETTAAVLAQALDEAIAEVYDGCDVPDAALPSRPDPARAGTGGTGGPDEPGGTASTGDMAGPALLSAMAGLSALPASPYQMERVRREAQALSSAAPGARAPARRGSTCPWGTSTPTARRWQLWTRWTATSCRRPRPPIRSCGARSVWRRWPLRCCTTSPLRAPRA